MESTLLPMLVLAARYLHGSYACAGLYGVACCCPVMATTAMQQLLMHLDQLLIMQAALQK
jgi:Na+/H+-translocating membrane pyrophosphatase